MLVLVGGILGAAAGAAAWLVAGRYDDPAPACADGEGPPRASRRPPAAPALAAAAGMAAWGAYAAWQSSESALVVGAVVLSALLLALSLVDFRAHRLPNTLLLALLAWAVIQALWLGRPSLIMAGLGLLIGLALFMLIALLGRGAMGAGDVKLAAVLGAVVGYPLILPALLAGILAGGAAAILMLLTRRAGRKDYMAYGPYLALGAWMVWTRAAGLWP
jgi:leader peptidase (prepilin peptidase)/N-methyltransferase